MMKNVLIHSVCVGVLVVMSWTMAFAGAWTQEKGSFYHQATLNASVADHSFNDEGNSQPMADDGEFRDVNASYYLEYGLLNGLTLVSSLAYKSLKFEDSSVESKACGVSDIDLALRYKLMDSPWGIVSVQGLVKIPEAYDEEDTLPLGSGQYDVECRILYGKSLYPVFPGYVNLEAGYRWRDEIPADEWRYLVEIGMDISQALYGRMKLDGILSVGNSDDSTSSSGNPSVTPESDLGKLDIVFGYKVSKSCSMELGVRPEIYGQNTSKGINTSIAIAFKR